MRSFLLVATAAVLAFSACPGAGDTPDAGLPALDCPGVFQCVADCPTSTGTTCEDACVARGTSAAVSQVNAVTNCSVAHSCNDSSTCLQMNCAPELAACAGTGTGGGGGGGGGSDGFPARYVGTVTDHNQNFGGVVLDSTGTATFVRDDSIDARGSQGWAMYRLETITYTSTASGMDLSGCTWSANETVTKTNPSSADNLLGIKKTPDAQGAYTYDITTTLSENRSAALTITCPPPTGARTADFSADNDVAASVPLPTTTSFTHLQASVPAYMQPSRTWSWDLTGQN